MTMFREWRHLKLLKRGGLWGGGLSLERKAWGACAVECPACPHPRKNLPDNWGDETDKRYAFFTVFDQLN